MTTETEDVELTHAGVVGLLSPAVAAKADREKGDRDYKRLTKIIRAYLDEHRGEELYDGEHRIKAFFQVRSGSKELDCMNLAARNPTLALWAMEHGLLSLNKKAWEGLAGQSQEMAQLEGYVTQGAGSEALMVQEEKHD